MMKYRILSENICKWVETTMAKWENAGIKDEKIDDAARLFFWSVGILSWGGFEFHKYLDAAAEMLKAMSEIERLLPQTTDEFFRKEVYPVILSTCRTALSHLTDWLYEMKA